MKQEARTSKRALYTEFHAIRKQLQMKKKDREDIKAWLKELTEQESELETKRDGIHKQWKAKIDLIASLKTDM
jgi:alpha-galactosidase/6-phospho-beta-glucosidase family protein